MINQDLSEPFLFDHEMSINVSYGHFYSSFPMHWHNFLEIIVPLTDNYSLTFGNSEAILNYNQIALVPPRTLHSISKTDSQPNLIIQFSNQLLPQLHDFVIHRQLFWRQPIFDCRDSSFSENPLELLLKLRDSFYAENPFRELYMYETLIHFFIVLGERNDKMKQELSASKTPQQKVYDKKFAAIAKYLQEHCSGPVSMEETAAFAGFSKYHFSRCFREYFQMSFPEYVTSLRLSKAAELLENPDLSILEAAMQSGFSSLASFNRAFKQHNRCTPSQFRKMADYFPLNLRQ